MHDQASNIVVFHSGALGDSVLLWPLLRRLCASARVTLVTDFSKGALAARELGIHAMSSEHPRFSRLWREHTPEPDPRVTRVVSFLTDRHESVWAINARAAYPAATLELHPAPIDRNAALRFAAGEDASPRFRANDAGPVVLHVGAGSGAKRWPMDRWASLAGLLGGDSTETRSISSGAAPVFVAGEAEAEGFTPADQDRFAALGGRFLTDLGSLADLLRSARLFLGNDSGPTHLAAQLGVRTVALFGPTDPGRWAPIGPAVAVLAPPEAAPMDWLSVKRAAAFVREFLGGATAVHQDA